MVNSNPSEGENTAIKQTGQPPKKFLDEVRDVLRVQHYS